jgi:protein-tyrosine phosphatase
VPVPPTRCAIITGVIDLHSHILPGIDDGPATLEGSIELARAAVAAGTRTILATPHINDDPSVEPERIAAGLVELRAALAEAEIPLEVLPGGEIAIWRLIDLDDQALGALALGGGPYLLVESPFSPVIGDFEPMVLDLHQRGHRVLLAHPERCPAFQRTPARLEGLVSAGALVQLTAGSMAGGFGSTVRRFTIDILREGLAHVVASDAHDTVRRPPGLRAGFSALERDLPGLGEHAEWLTQLVPRAVLDGAPLPARPPLPRPPGLLRRLGLRA